MDGSPGLKSDWLEENNSFAMKYSYNLLHIKRWKFFPQIASKDMGQ